MKLRYHRHVHTQAAVFGCHGLRRTHGFRNCIIIVRPCQLKFWCFMLLLQGPGDLNASAFTPTPRFLCKTTRKNDSYSYYGTMWSYSAVKGEWSIRLRLILAKVRPRRTPYLSTTSHWQYCKSYLQADHVVLSSGRKFMYVKTTWRQLYWSQSHMRCGIKLLAWKGENGCRHFILMG